MSPQNQKNTFHNTVYKISITTTDNLSRLSSGTLLRERFKKVASSYNFCNTLTRVINMRLSFFLLPSDVNILPESCWTCRKFAEKVFRIAVGKSRKNSHTDTSRKSRPKAFLHRYSSKSSAKRFVVTKYYPCRKDRPILCVNSFASHSGSVAVWTRDVVRAYSKWEGRVDVDTPILLLRTIRLTVCKRFSMPLSRLTSSPNYSTSNFLQLFLIGIFFMLTISCWNPFMLKRSGRHVLKIWISVRRLKRTAGASRILKAGTITSWSKFPHTFVFILCYVVVFSRFVWKIITNQHTDCDGWRELGWCLEF